jgi:hypothetical protein
MHFLNNSFFETKKLLEHDDTQSGYLIYSPESERDAQSNWLPHCRPHGLAVAGYSADAGAAGE